MLRASALGSGTFFNVLGFDIDRQLPFMARGLQSFGFVAGLGVCLAIMQHEINPVFRVFTISVSVLAILIVDARGAMAAAIIAILFARLPMSWIKRPTAVLIICVVLGSIFVTNISNQYFLFRRSRVVMGVCYPVGK